MKHEQTELELYILHSSLVYSQVQTIMRKLSQVHAYNEEPEIPTFRRLLIHIAYLGAVQYNREFNSSKSDWREIFTFEDLQVVASILADHYEVEFREMIAENGIRDSLEAFRDDS